MLNLGFAVKFSVYFNALTGLVLSSYMYRSFPAKAAALQVEGPNKGRLIGDLNALKLPQQPHDYSTFKKKALGKHRVRRPLCLRRKGHAGEKKKQRVKMIKTPYGRGLVARCRIANGDLVVCYGGLKITTKENLGTAAGRKRAGVTDMSYLLRLENGEYRQGGIPNDIALGRLGSIANDPYGSGRDANVFFSEDPENPAAGGEAYLVSMRSIEKGEEILVDYGWTPRTWKRVLRKEKDGAVGVQPDGEPSTQRELFL